MNKRRLQGFTIIELIVVIAAIGILAAISTVGYGAWRGRIEETQVKQALTSVAASMENARVFSNAYPLVLPTDITIDSAVTVSLTSASAKSFCVDGYLTATPATTYYIDDLIAKEGPNSGTCATRVNLPIPDMPTSVALDAAYGTSIELSWSNAANATGYVSQCAADPAFITDRQETTVTGTSASINSLLLGNTYYCRVKAVNASGSSAWADAIVAQTSNNYGSLAVATSIEGYWNSAPQGFLFEDGSAVSRATYADLFAVIGTTYGAGDGSTTFNLPNSRGRASVAVNASDAEFNTIGEKYGTKTETLSIAQMPSHTHIQNAHNHTQDAHGHDVSDAGHTHSQNAHNHTQNAHNHNGGMANPFVSDGSFGSASVATQSGSSYGFRYGAAMPSTTAVNNSTTATNLSSTTGIYLSATTATNQSTVAVNQNNGGGGSHNNIQPSIVKRYAIKYTTPDTQVASLPEGSSINGYWSSAPDGYLLENGQTVSKTTYPELFAVIGYTYGGSGDTFALPDSRGRVSVNKNASDTQFDVIGEKSGEKTHVVTIAEMPSHTHTQNAHTHIQDAHTHAVNDPGHNHTQNAHTHTQVAHNHSGAYANPYVTDGSLGGASVASQNGLTYGFKLGQGASTTATNNATTATNNSTTSGVAIYSATATNNAATATNQNTGGDTAHNEIQPSIARMSAIKATPTLATGAKLATGTSLAGYWSTAPQGFLIEDGSAVSRTLFADLFAVIGTTYGAGNGTTTFNLPDSRGRTSVNLNPSDTEFDTMGEKPGSKTETLSLAQLPSHTHIQDAHTHTQNSHNHSVYDPGHTHTQNAHTHTQNAHSHGSGYVNDGSFGGTSALSAAGLAYGFRLSADPMVTATNQSTTATNNGAFANISLNAYTATNQSTTAVNQSTGGGGAHNNLQPSIVKLFVIKY